MGAWLFHNFRCCSGTVLLCVLQLRNILQQVDSYLNKSGKREGEYSIFYHKCFSHFIWCV